MKKVDKSDIHDASAPVMTADTASKTKMQGGGLEADLAKSLAQYRKFVKSPDEDDDDEDDEFK